MLDLGIGGGGGGGGGGGAIADLTVFAGGRFEFGAPPCAVIPSRVLTAQETC